MPYEFRDLLIRGAGPRFKQTAWAWWLLRLALFSHRQSTSCQQPQINLLLVNLLLLLQQGKLHSC